MNQINQKKHSRAIFYGLLALLLGLCFIRYALQVNFPRSILLVLAVLIALLGDRDEIIAMCICCIPLHTSFHYVYALLFCIVIYVVKFGRSIRLNLTIVPVLLMILWELPHCFGLQFSPVTFVSDFIPLLLLAVIMCSDIRGLDYGLIVRAMAVSVAAMCILLIGKLAYVANFNLVAVVAGLQRLGLDAEETQNLLTVSGGEQNPNTLGIMCVLAISGLMQLRMAGKGTKSDVLLVIFLLVFGTLTSSRTYLACLAVMALLLLFSQKGNLTRKFRFLAILVAVVLLAVVLLCLIFPELMAYYFSRFQVEDVTTGRIGLMARYHDFIVSDPKIMFFGIGLHEFYARILEVYRVASHVPHNGIQELVLAWGIPGLLLFLALWLAMTFRSRNFCRRQRLLNYIPMLILLAKIQAGQMLTSAYTMLAFSYAYLSMAQDFSTDASAKTVEEEK